MIAEPSNINCIFQKDKHVVISYQVSDNKIYQIQLPKKVPIEKVLAAYTAAMVTPRDTLINIGYERSKD